MIDTELFELCDEVHKLTKWDDDSQLFSIKKSEFGEIIFSTNKLGDNFVYGPRTPFYTSDYLLEKLPSVIQDPDDKKFKHIQMWINGDGTANAGYVEPYAYDDKVAYAQESDEMRKTLLKLTIVLHNTGELSTNNKGERVMKVMLSTEDKLEFDNGLVVEGIGDVDCCANNYLDFGQFELGQKFPMMTAGEFIDAINLKEDGFSFTDSDGMPKWCQARSEQNGYYSSCTEVKVTYDGKTISLANLHGNLS